MGETIRVAIVTVSDTVARGERPDRSGPAVQARCERYGWGVASADVVPDDRAAIEALLKKLVDGGKADAIFTTGGTGLGPRDVTPEATVAVAERLVPGLGEQMRAAGMKATPRAVLSRSVAAVRGRVLIVNLPGSPKGAAESLDAIAEVVPHAVRVLHGARHD